MQRRQQKVKCEDTLRAGKEQIKRLIAVSAGMAVESATGDNVSFCSAALYGESLLKGCKKFFQLMIEHWISLDS
jgi:hypothetical protein